MAADAPVAPRAPATRRMEPRRAVRLADVLDLLPATWHLWRAERALRTRERGALLAIAATVPDVPVDPARLPQALRLGRATARAARYGPVRAKCLAASIGLRAWLLRHGIEGAVVRIGVRQSPTGVQAHAWVTYGDTVLGDSPSHVNSFTPIAASALPGLPL